MADEDTRRLIPMSIKHLDGDKWMISIDGGESYTVKGDFDSIKKAVRRIKGKDGENCGKCKSKKVNTYASMISADDNTEHKINVWKSKVPHDAKSFAKLMENKEIVNMKQITLTKNYLVEGNIIPKGTVITLKEEIGFLPTDVWEKAKEIDDKEERFEFVKKEVGDEFSDEEIKTFLDKYESKLEESLKKMTKDDIDDMLMIIKETVQSEKEIDDKTLKTVLDKAKDNKTLLTAWDNLLNADDSKFNKVENKFWDLFDDFIKDFELKNAKDRNDKTA